MKFKQILVGLLSVLLVTTLSASVVNADTTTEGTLKSAGITTVPTEGEDAPTSGGALEIAKHFINPEVIVEGNKVFVSGSINKKYNPWDLEDTTSSTVGIWYGVRVLFPKDMVGTGEAKYKIYYGSIEREASQTYEEGATAVRLALTVDDVKKDGLEEDGTFKIQFDWNADGEKDETFYIDTTGIKLLTDYVLTDNDSNVTFESDTKLEEGYTLKVENVTFDDKNSIVASAKDMIAKELEKNKNIKDLDILTTYDISVMNGEEVVKMENGNYKISLIANEDLLKKYSNFKVVYIDENGKVAESIAAVVNGNTVTFETSHLSTYSLVGYNTEDANDTTTDETNKTDEVKNPNTGDNIMFYIILSAISFGALGLGALNIKKRLNF